MAIEFPVIEDVPREYVEALLYERDRAITQHAKRTVNRDLFCRRVYVCRRCGHETPTLGFPLTDPRCFIGPPGRRCGGALRCRYG